MYRNLLLFFLAVNVFSLNAQNVGIGVPNPAYKLDVAGEGRFDKGHYVNKFLGNQSNDAPYTSYVLLFAAGNVSGVSNHVAGKFYGRRVSGNTANMMAEVVINQSSNATDRISGFVNYMWGQRDNTLDIKRLTYNGDEYIALEISSDIHQVYSSGIWFSGQCNSDAAETLTLVESSSVSNVQDITLGHSIGYNIGASTKIDGGLSVLGLGGGGDRFVKVNNNGVFSSSGINYTDISGTPTLPDASKWNQSGSLLYPKSTAWNIGIGNSSPSYKLDVTGTGRFTGQLTVPLAPSAAASATSKAYVDAQIAGTGDNLGNHTATTSINANDQEVRNVRAIQGKDWDDNSGGTDSKYRLLYRDGAHMFYNGGVVVGGYGNGTWSNLASGTLIVKENQGIGRTDVRADTKLDVDGAIGTSRMGIGGTYSSAQVQGIWSIEPNYKISTANNDFGNQYGLAYAYHGAGTNTNKKPIAGWGHQILFTSNGVRNASISLSSGHAYFAGNVGIGLTNPSTKLHVNGRIRSNGINETSDKRLKKNIHTLENSLDKVMALRGVNYEWRTEEFPDREFEEGMELGVIAQEVEGIFPELVRTDEDGFKSVQYSHLVPVLIEAIKDLTNKVEKNEAEYCLAIENVKNSHKKTLKTKSQELKQLKLEMNSLKAEFSEIKELIEMSTKN